jgi:hypothetical protein
MAKMLIVAALLAILAPPGTADAGAVVCNVPRALLCDGCASGIVVSFMPTGNCRIAFTPGTAAPTSEGVVPVTFVFGPLPRTRWVSRPKPKPALPVLRAQPAPFIPPALLVLPAQPAQPAPFTPPAPPAGLRDGCLVFNGNRYCE